MKAVFFFVVCKAQVSLSSTTVYQKQIHKLQSFNIHRRPAHPHFSFMFTDSFWPCVDSGEGGSEKSSFSLSPRWVLCSHPVLIKRKWGHVCYLGSMKEQTSSPAVFHSLLSANSFIFPLPPCSVSLYFLISITEKLFPPPAHTQSDVSHNCAFRCGV
ncbi:hypothetical protein QQF64_013875 [Cirrhinus molitorella]|uniref:Secreted protein n=1 Tax=Cirrhinus molitorella TaxID=172907 RepID=A0ABR3LSE8_9TELE